MSNITKEQFAEYRRCQELGYWNMYDYTSWSRVTTLSKDEWIAIIENYCELKERYEA